jgi:acetylornithine deacetylase/succinyl-diaminopimelate desuccinylase-like protein
MPKGITMEVTMGHSGPWYLTDPHSAMGEAVQRALRKAFNRDAALIREGGSIPIVSNSEILASKHAHGTRIARLPVHSPNENFPLENFEGGIRLNKAILQELRSRTAICRGPARIMPADLLHVLCVRCPHGIRLSLLTRISAEGSEY